MANADGHIASSTTRIAIAAVAVLGNLLILVVVARNRNLRRSGANILLAQLAFADIVIGIGTGTRGVSAIVFGSSGQKSFHRATCIILGFPTILGIHLSQTTMVAIALDRLFSIRFPVLYRRMETVAFGMLRFFVCCLYSIFGSCLPLFGLMSPDPIPVCSIGLAALPWFSSYWIFFSSVLTIFIFVLYTAIYFIFTRRRTASVGKSAAQKTITVTITAILVSYFFLYCIPNLSILVVNITGVTPLWVSLTSLVTGIGSGLNAAGNVFIYGWKHSELRAAMKRVPFLRHLIFCHEKTVTVATVTPVSAARINSKMYS
ncbi:hypothetical protein QR680_008630 [Steinernema hermaphroditum]|uniref:G-protein coupled receptors family 1 profile domain-containing protein n=1 Tax=Steinernema hermaphroditum TaxID=289476 RepID=A0AA39IHA5_9BILA|nr:hypothetical protein QR680_008630 [Steinernema hermaphroditum]